MKNSFLILTSALTTFSFAQAAQAAPSFSGSITASYLASDMWSTDDDDQWNSFSGVSVEGYVTAEFANGLQVTTDISWLYRDLSAYGNPSTEYSDQGPREYEVLGLHVGKNFGSLYVGAFGAVGFQQTDMNSSIMRPGFVGGLEAKKSFGKLTVFGQVAYMDWRYDTWANRPTPDNGFSGLLSRVGASYQFSDRLSAMFDFEAGYSPDYFEDYGDWGELLVGQLQVAYAITDRLDIVAGYEYGTFTANTEDSGYESNVTIGVRMNFGGASGFNELSTPVQGFAAAGWAQTTD